MQKKSFWCSISWTLLTYSHYLTLTLFPTFARGFTITLKSALAGKSSLCTEFPGWKMGCILWRREGHPKSGSSILLHVAPWDQARLDGALSDLARGVASLPVARGLEWKDLSGPLQPKTFHDSVSPWLALCPGLWAKKRWTLGSSSSLLAPQ